MCFNFQINWVSEKRCFVSDENFTNPRFFWNTCIINKSQFFLWLEVSREFSLCHKLLDLNPVKKMRNCFLPVISPGFAPQVGIKVWPISTGGTIQYLFLRKFLWKLNGLTKLKIINY